jgi:hypothetical protein
LGREKIGKRLKTNRSSEKMGRQRFWFKMTTTEFNRILSVEGKVPRCVHCGVKLLPGTKVLSKYHSNKRQTAHSKRYCEKCRRLLRIWTR